jgi:hypothetical protein
MVFSSVIGLIVVPIVQAAGALRLNINVSEVFALHGETWWFIDHNEEGSNDA